MPRLAPALAVLCLLPACRMIDRETFAAKGNAPSEADLDRSKLPPLPFVTIRMDDPDADFRPALADAVQEAESRKPDVEFDVLAPVPTNATQEVQDICTKNGAADTEAVAMALGYDGVSLDRVHVGFRGDPGSPAREVRIYLR